MEHVKSNSVPRKIRHLSYNQGSVNFQSFYESKGLRTLLPIQQYSYMSQQVPPEMFERLRFIRVLDLSFIKIRELPNSIGGLQHLRYLNLCGTDIKQLPESICNIYNLQTLLLRGCQNLVELPSETRKLINLRHLDLECNKIVSMPPQIGRLIFLQTLPLFVAGKEKERGIAELKDLTNIHGKLVIRNMENVVEAEHAREANLNNKPFIEELSLVWKEESDHAPQNEVLEVEVANGLKPHSNLKALAFSGYMGSHFPSWMLKIDMLLSNVKVLHLINCKRCNLLPPLGRLRSLSGLTVSGMDEVKKIESMCGGLVGGFPSLRVLLLRNMSNLEQWQENEGDFPRLQRLQIINCSQLRQIPNGLFPNLTTLQICSCAMLVALPPLPSLKQLVLDNLHNLEEWCDIGEAHFPHLQSLNIYNCPKIRRWPSSLPVITELDVSLCPGFDALPLLPSLCKLRLFADDASMLKSVTYLTSLSSLSISAVSGLTPMLPVILQELTQLKDLEIQSYEEPVTFQDGGLSGALTSLSFFGCFGFESLPRGLHNLTSLHALKITQCLRLKSLPDEGLPPALQRLEISNCPLLKERCLRDGGEDWPKISHIPHVQIKDL